MSDFSVFLTVVCVIRGQADRLEQIVQELGDVVAPLVSDYELVVVDNASADDSLAVLKRLTGAAGHPNLQVYALTKEVDPNTASWVGLENALGDFVAVLDPLTEDIRFLPRMLEEAVNGADVVFASNTEQRPETFGHRVAYRTFNALYRTFSGIDLAREAPQYRIISKRVIGFLLQHPQPAMSYRYLPATAGFAKSNLTYTSPTRERSKRRLRSSVELGTRMLVSSTRAPMRLVTSLSLFGAAANVVYSFYVVGVALLKKDVAAGWVSLSLQQSGMFLLISLVLLVLGEYILNVAILSHEGPAYHVAQEFTSMRVTRREKLNVEHVAAAPLRVRQAVADPALSQADA